jgi:hypothetical protein
MALLNHQSILQETEATRAHRDKEGGTQTTGRELLE